MPDLKPNIVVVDDDLEMNQAIRRLLSAAGFCAVAFNSAEACLEASSKTSAGCLVLDVHLHGLSGFELYRRLLQKGFEVPVIFISAYDDPDSRAQAQDAGAIAYFTKPFPGKNLLAAVEKAIDSGPENN
jgi:FixJ family two-component response regulator